MLVEDDATDGSLPQRESVILQSDGPKVTYIDMLTSSDNAENNDFSRWDKPRSLSEIVWIPNLRDETRKG